MARFFNQQDHKKIFNRYANPATSKMSQAQFMAALHDLGMFSELHDPADNCKEADMDEDGGMDLEEFSRVISNPSKLEMWSNTLPLAKLMAFCLESADERISIAPDPVRNVCDLDLKVVDVIVDGFAEGVKQLLRNQLKQMSMCYSALERKAAEEADGSGSKFQTFSMSAGNAEDFHRGLTDRVGERVQALPPCVISVSSLNPLLVHGRPAPPGPRQGRRAGALRDGGPRRAVYDDQLRPDDDP